MPNDNARARARELRDSGASYRVIAATLAAEGITPVRGSTWWPASIAQLLGYGSERYKADAARERHNEVVRRSRQRQKGEPSVYGIWFPSPRILKVGFTAHTRNSIFVAVARTRAKRRGWEIEGSQCIWKQPGDMRTEAWIQATLAFRWPPAFEQKHDRLCEWFMVPASAGGGITEVLGHIYGQVPVDLTG